MFGNAKAIAAFAAMAGDETFAGAYRDKAARLRDLTLGQLWNRDGSFFETLDQSGELANVRENIGFTPWYFDLPPEGGGHEAAWKQLTDDDGFRAPYGPTTCERRSPKFQLTYVGDDCKWNGPSWPFATTITLASLKPTYSITISKLPQPAAIAPLTFRTYVKSQHLQTG